MRERPILFSGPMVRAILEGRKTVTRRVMKPQPVLEGNFWTLGGAGWSDRVNSVTPVAGHSLATRCPYGQPGDRLWVREAWSIEMLNAFSTDQGYDSTYELSYRAGGDEREIHVAPGEPDPYLKLYDNQRGDWRPSIHMPRWASRILLEITDVRVERLQDISDEQALAEGVDQTNTSIPGYARQRFQDLWESINGAGSWGANPWVWEISFRRIQP